MAREYTMHVLHVLSHTHWDREWYQTFQAYRRRLVEQTDAMMDVLEERAGFRYFHLDGQTSVLSDYLEIRPENRERLGRLIKSGRVLIGPWFTMPDEVLLSGESLVRNLLLGHAECAEWGTAPMPVGYVTDVFGHVSQTPQIFAGFGFDA
ncbi:MAG: glycoside hydrolase family 38 N-terminal domain-containing protein, partial [Planctomycetota bacterium]